MPSVPAPPLSVSQPEYKVRGMADVHSHAVVSRRVYCATNIRTSVATEISNLSLTAVPSPAEGPEPPWDSAHPSPS